MARMALEVVASEGVSYERLTTAFCFSIPFSICARSIAIGEVFASRGTSGKEASAFEQTLEREVY